VTNENESINLGNATNEIANAVSYAYVKKGIFEAFPVEVLKQFPNVYNINFYRNSIKQLTPQSFENGANLRFIDLRYNKLTSITAEMFRNLPVLSTLYLSNNQISKIDDNAFSGTPQLVYIDARSNNLTSITFINVIQNISYLNVQDNSVEEINFSVNFPRFSSLYIQNNKVSRIFPASFYNTPNLYLLDFSSNVCYEKPLRLNQQKIAETVQGELKRCFQLWYDSYPTTEVPTTEAPTTEAPTTEVPTTEAPTTEAPTTEVPITEAPTTKAPTTQVPTTPEPTTQAPTTQAPITTTANQNRTTTQAPTTQAPTTTTANQNRTTTTKPKPIPTYQCNFYIDRIFGYSCALTSINYQNETSGNFYISGKHLKGKNNNQVNGVVFLRSTLAKVPQIIFKQFKNLTHLDASNTGLKIADENTLEICGKLKHLDAKDNDIERITENFLNRCKDLEKIDLNNNLISAISPCGSFLKSQKKLKDVTVLFNGCIDQYFYDENLISEYDKILAEPFYPCFVNYLKPVRH
jgi:Leucine rich repeat/BspA type Leucine rich repeat region (6 copies)